MKQLDDTTTLSNGVKMPWFGLGVYKVEDGRTATDAVRTAISYGYRSIDTASFYQNEIGVGEGIRQAGIPREKLFVTSKVWNDQQGYEKTLQAFSDSLEKLGLDYLDLYLIHWPVKGRYKDTWRALEKLYRDKKVRAIGVSNFHVHHLENLMAGAEVKPMVNQVEYHPHLTQQPLKSFCERQNIQLEAWSPLKRGQLFENQVLAEIGEKYQKTIAQVILRWDLQNHVVTIPKSIHADRIRENADVFDFSLSDEDMRAIDALNRNDRSGTNPDSYDEK
ncbi:aldo/keto reductase [Virgibacillus halophilus]|uniref:aldo/keto reductase n=1 Tax=Tigheibacillus halophilus TaxID=361280 RepID=UPI003627461F